MLHPLLLTKLHRPRPRAGSVPRPRLTAMLAPALERKLTLVAAPPGYGKTALVAEWLSGLDARGVRVAWLSLDEGDNDPARFWLHAATALEQAQAGAGADALAALRPSGPAAVVPALLGALAALSCPVVLVLDDYHVIAADAIHGTVALLLQHLPAAVHLVLTTRQTPPLPLAQLRVRGELLEVGVRDLRFTVPEVEAFLGTEGGAAALHERTEGWAAGLQLASLALREGGNLADVLTGLVGSHGYVAEYLAQEVLQRQPPALHSFLLETAMLEQLTGPLCDAVTGRSDSGRVLTELEQGGVFTVPLDGQRRWYRYHRLMRDALRQQRGPAPDLHRKASAWYEAQGLLDDALHHAIQAEDYDRAANLLERLAEPLADRGEFATLLTLLEAVPWEKRLARPALVVEQARALLLTGRPREAAALRLPDTPEALALQSHLLRAASDTAGALRCAREAGAQLPEQATGWRTLAAMGLANACSTAGDLPGAELATAEATAIARAAGNIDMVVLTLCFRGELLESLDRLDGAGALYREALGQPGANDLPAAGWACVGQGRLRYERNDPAGAVPLLQRGLAHAQRFGHLDTLVRGYGYLALAREALGDTTGATATLDEAAQALVLHRSPFAEAALELARARLHIARGKLADAEAWARAYTGRPLPDPGLRRQGDQTLAQLRLLQGQPAESLRLLAGIPLENVRLFALRATALAATGQENEGLALMRRALTAAAAEGHVRAFGEAGAGALALLRRCTDTLAPAGRHAAAVLQALAPETTAPAPLIEPLSEREREILGLIAVGLSNEAIASQVYITVGTVKRHLHNIYGKLGASSRTQALALARSLGLLP